jgi:hypothetical protein
MAQADAIRSNPAHAVGFPATHRKDAWWVGPLLTGLGLGGFVVYATFRALYNAEYDVGIGAISEVLPDHAFLLSPFYSPNLAEWGLVPAWLNWVSPAIFILWMPGGFRVTCYYYRKAYYRAFFLDPAGCSVGEPHHFCGVSRGREYKGETKLLLFQNLHRYFLYIALAFLVLLSLDFVWSCLWPTPSGGRRFGVSLGSLVLLGNVTLLSLYTFSCHSLRHLVGGGLDCFSKSPWSQFRYKLWVLASKLNADHMLWAWTSLFMVAFADLYVWLVASGMITDVRFF